MRNKVKQGTEKYPTKRGYAIGKLQKFLKLTNLTKKFKKNCKEQQIPKGQRDLCNSFNWINSDERYVFWSQVNEDFNHFVETGKVFTVYGD